MKTASVFVFLLLASAHVSLAVQAASLGSACSFVQNNGQMRTASGEINRDVMFSTMTPHLNVQLRRNGFSYDCSIKQADQNGYAIERIDVDFLNANSEVRIEARDKQSAIIHDYRSGDVSGIHAACFKTIVYRDVYPGIDVQFTISKANAVEYDIIVHPTGDVSDVQLLVSGPSKIEWQNGLTMKLSQGVVHENVPEVYTQETRKPVNLTGFVNGNVLSFSAEYDHAQTLVIDPVPVLTWGSYFGGGIRDIPLDVTTHPEGGCVITGFTTSTTGIATSGAHQSIKSDTADAFIARFDTAGALLWATYYGGTGDEVAAGSTVDDSGNIYIIGFTYSKTQIATPGAFDEDLGGGNDMYLVKFDPTGVRVWGTYFGNENGDEGVDVAMTQSGDIAFAAISGSGGLATAGTNQNSVIGSADLLVGMFSSDGDRLWATYVGGNGYEEPFKLAIAAGDELVICGYTTSDTLFSTAGSHQVQYGGNTDGLVVRVGPTGLLKWATYLGGSDFDYVYGIAIDPDGNILVSGETASANAIATTGSFQEQLGGNIDGFVDKFDASGSRIWGTYLGGILEDAARMVVCRDDSEIIVVGITSSAQTFGTTAAISINLRGSQDGFICSLDPSGAQLWSTYIGGDLYDQIVGADVDGADHMYITGETTSTNFISTPGVHQENWSDDVDAYLMRIAICIPPTPSFQLDDRCMNRNGSIYSTPNIPGNTYQWSFPPEAVIIAGQDSSTCTVVWTQSGSVIISVLETSPMGCDAKAAVSTFIFPELRPDVQSISGELEACEGDTIFLKAQDGFFNYEWNTGDTGQVLAVTTTGFYQVTASDTMCTGMSDSVSVNFLPLPLADITGSASICLNGTTSSDYSVSQSANAQYLWTRPTLGNATSTLSAPILNVNWTQAGTDTLRVTVIGGNGCQQSGEYEVVIGDSLMPSIGSSTGSFTLCDGDSLFLLGDTTIVNAQYMWSTGETTYKILVKQSGTYWVRIDDGNCNGTSDIVTVTIEGPNPMILGSSAVCRTDNDSAVYAVQNVIGDSYSWFDPSLGTIITPKDQSQITIVWHSAGSDTVGVVETSPSGCRSTAGLIVTISEGVTVTISEDNGTLVADIVAADEYAWLDEAQQHIDNATSQRFTPSAGGIYYVEVRIGACWSISAPFTFNSMQHTDKFSVSDVDFGSLPINAIVNASGGHVNEIIVVNLSQQDIALDSASLQGEGFEVPNQFPRLLHPGDTSHITVRFKPTERKEYVATVIIHFGSEIGFSQLKGIGRDLAPDERITEVILQPDRLEVVPGEQFDVILSIGSESPTATTGQEYEATMQWDARVLELVSTPEVFFRTTGREDNYYTAKVPEGVRTAGQIRLINIPFRAKLGEIDSTVLVFSGAVAFRWKDDTKAFPACRDSVVHIKICREGGERLITKRSTATIAGVAPHPVDDRASIFIDAIGTVNVSLDLIDPLGSVVRHRDLGTIFGGRSDLQLDMSGLHAGPYILRLNYGDGATSRLVIRR